jgi:phage protein D
VVACSTTGNVKTLKDTFSSAEAARQAAQSEMQRVDRGAATLILALSLDQPHLMPQATGTVEGFKPEIDSEDWLVKSVEHTLGDGGFTTHIELERQGDGNARDQEDVEDLVNDPKK